MPDTRRSKSTLQSSYLEDNNTQNITPQDVRDFCESVHPENANKSGAHASQPTSDRVVGDQYWPNDGFHTARWNGTLWEAWGPLFPMKRPVDSEFSWVNQGAAIVTEAGGGIYLDSVNASGSTATPDWNMRTKALPAAPYTITAAFVTANPADNYLDCGLILRKNSDGKFVTFEYFYNSALAGGWGFGSGKWNGLASFSANYTVTGGLTGGRLGLIWMRVKDDNTNRILQVSADGKNFRTIHTVGRTDFITPDEIGFFVNGQSVSLASSMTLLSWKEE